jgi:hypothetical protein
MHIKLSSNQMSVIWMFGTFISTELSQFVTKRKKKRFSNFLQAEKTVGLQKK